jgi:hypothetical protein
VECLSVSFRLTLKLRFSTPYKPPPTLKLRFSTPYKPPPTLKLRFSTPYGVSAGSSAHAEALLQHSIWRVGVRFRLTLKLRFSTR